MSAWYSLFGLRIRSELELDAPAAAAGEADVDITLGAVPEFLEGHPFYNPFNQAAPGRLLLAMPGVARYLVTAGKSIVVEPDPAADDRSLALFTTVSPLAGILHQRGRVCLHASAVGTGKGTIIFVAPSGVGKSTLAAALGERGYELVSDDISALESRQDGLWSVSPGSSRLKLWPDTLAALGQDAAGLQPIRPGLEKRFLPVERRAQSPRPLLAVCALGMHSGSEIRIDRMPRARALESLLFNTYRRRMQAAVDSVQANVQRLSRIAAALPCFSVQRPGSSFSLDPLLDRVEGLMAGL
jgi:hypothetical protein